MDGVHPRHILNSLSAIGERLMEVIRFTPPYNVTGQPVGLRDALMTDQARRRLCSLGAQGFLTALIALALSSCGTSYSQCLHNGGGVFRCTVSSGRINQGARASTFAECSAGDEQVCHTACDRTRDPQICDMWFAIKCPTDPSVCQSACHLAHDRVACRGACEAGDQAACTDYFQMVQ